MDEQRLENLPLDIWLVILRNIETSDVFNLMLVSKNICKIAYNEYHWKKRLYILFTKNRIKRRGYDNYKSYRLAAVKMINTQYSQNILSQGSRLNISEIQADFINRIFRSYLKYISLIPFELLPSVIITEFPNYIIYDKNINSITHTCMLEILVCENLVYFQSRFGIIKAFISHVLEYKREFKYKNDKYFIEIVICFLLGYNTCNFTTMLLNGLMDSILLNPNKEYAKLFMQSFSNAMNRLYPLSFINYLNSLKQVLNPAIIRKQFNNWFFELNGYIPDDYLLLE